MADPTNARMRTLNSFFESPRFAIKELPTIADDPIPATPQPAVTAPTPPTLTVGLEPAAKRTLKGFLDAGLLVKVTANRPLADLEVRLFEQLAGNKLRPPRPRFKREANPRRGDPACRPHAFRPHPPTHEGQPLRAAAGQG